MDIPTNKCHAYVSFALSHRSLLFVELAIGLWHESVLAPLPLSNESSCNCVLPQVTWIRLLYIRWNVIEIEAVASLFSLMKHLSTHPKLCCLNFPSSQVVALITKHDRTNQKSTMASAAVPITCCGREGGCVSALSRKP